MTTETDNSKNTGSLLVGLGGGSCAGKTTIAGEVVKKLLPIQSTILTCDRYYRPLDHLPLEKRHLQDFDSLEMLDHDLLENHLARFKAGQAVEAPIYDYREHTRAGETETLTAPTVLIVEGILILSEPRIADLLDLKIYAEADADLRLSRRIRRDRDERGRSADSVLDQYLTTVRPAHNKLVAPAMARADLVVRGDGDAGEGADRIVERIRSILGW